MRFLWLALICWPVLAAAQQSGGVLIGQTPQSNGPPAPPTRPEDLCSIEGQAVNSVTGEPVKKAQVVIANLGGRNRSNTGAISDAGGHFTIENIEPGRYNLAVERNGYVRFEYGSLVTLDPGQHLRDLVFRLVPQGVITGHVLDEDGEPMEHVQVSAMRYGYFNGRRQMSTQASVSTDDQGEYRAFGLAPGKYYVSATYHANSMVTMQDRKPAGQANEGYVPTYYPGTFDPTGAMAIEVAPGASLAGIDIALHKTRTVRIRGHVSNPAEDPPRYVSILLVPKNSEYFNSPYVARVNPARGNTFEIRDIAPGSYSLIAQWADAKNGHVARQPLEVGNNNLDDVEVVLAPFLAIKGQVRVDGTADVNLASIFIRLEPRGAMPMGYPNTQAAQDGTFTLEMVNPDTYTLFVHGLPQGFYVKSARMGDADALDAGLDLTRGSAGPLDIVVSPNGGEVDGTVADATGNFASGVTVILVPDASRRERTDLFQTTGTDTSGHFRLQGVSPGDYKLFAWQEVESGAYQDPDFLKPYESKGESVTVREGSHEVRQLKLIPVESTPKVSGN